MKQGETKLADQQGKFTQVVKDGTRVPEIEWVPGRILLSNRRMVLAGKQGKRTIVLGDVRSIKSRQDAQNPLAKVSSYISIQVGKDVMLVSPRDHESFEEALYAVVLDQEVIAVRHPAVEGGVVQSTDWEKGRLAVEFEDDMVALAVASGKFVEIALHDVGMVEENDGEVLGEERFFIEVEHTVEGTVVETHISGPQHTVNILAELLRMYEQQNTSDVALGDEESEVLMALYSGVSPFQIPEFVGMDVETVEEIYDDLVEAGLLQEQRVRREVQLKARGRNIASDAMGDE